jgi:exodeoxyribonuclease-3
VKIATWNVNSLRARQDLILDWLERKQPDVLCMQETKVTDAEFPTDEFQRLGYAVCMAGEKSYNGVAIAARKLLRNIRIGLVDAGPKDEKRLISATVGAGKRAVQLFCCYVPNGRSVESPSFVEKLAWLEQLNRSLETWAQPTQHVVVCGDFNIAADKRDIFDPEAFVGATHFHPEEHKRLDALKAWGLHDTFRLHHDDGGLYSWWDYRGSSFRKNEGLRIDYLFATESLKQCCKSVYMDAEERKLDKPSDHIPVVAEFEL